MSRENKQIEDVIIAEAFIKFRNILSLCTIVGLCVWVSLLAASNRDKDYELYITKKFYDSIYEGNKEIHKLDSITISQMPPVEYLDFLKRNKK